jgi:uncharacterized protein (TIGR02145 family)
MKTTKILTTLLFTGVLLTGCGKDDGAKLPDFLNPDLTYGEVSDIDGNSYRTIEIGPASGELKTSSMVWMAENLRTTKYANGDDIPRDDTFGADQPRWGYYDGEAKNNIPYGKLYNWNAIADDRNICPNGWHVPTKSEWEALRDYLDPDADGDDNIAGKKMKTPGSKYWKTSNNPLFPPNAGTNESGFSALPGGSSSGSNLGQGGYFWSSTQVEGVFEAWYTLLTSSSNRMTLAKASKGTGFSCRCVKD